jgi:hypothetical protein
VLGANFYAVTFDYFFISSGDDKRERKAKILSLIFILMQSFCVFFSNFAGLYKQAQYAQQKLLKNDTVLSNPLFINI